MADYNVTLELYQGIDFAGAYFFFNPDPSGFGNPNNLVPRNFTNYNARMMVRLANNAQSPLILSLTSSPAAGLSFVSGTTSPGPAAPAYPNGVQINITKAQTLAIANNYPGETQFAYDLMADNLGSGTTELLMCGPLILQSTVTR